MRQSPDTPGRFKIRRRTDSVAIFPNRAAIVRLVGAVLAEQTEEWAEGRPYLGLEVLARCRVNIVPALDPEIWRRQPIRIDRLNHHDGERTATPLPGA